MSISKQGKKEAASDKLHIIDRATYDKIHQINNDAELINAKHIVRNSKYRKTRDTFNLMHFFKEKPKSVARCHRRRGKKKPIIGTLLKPTAKQSKKRGKIYEGGRNKQYTKLKKNILQYRREKRLAQENILTPEKQLVQKMDLLSVSSSNTSCHKNTASVLHSRRFRDYCDNCLTPRLGQLTDELLRDLNRFQKRAYIQNEIKARAHRRFVVGFRELQTFLNIGKVKVAIIAADCEECTSKDGLDEVIATIKRKCYEKQVPCVFSLQRRQIAYALYKKVPVSCVAILDYDGARETVGHLLDELRAAKDCYSELQKTLSSSSTT